MCKVFTQQKGLQLYKPCESQHLAFEVRGLSLEIHELSDWNRHLSTPRPNFLHSQIGRLQQRLIALRQAIVFYCMGPVLQPRKRRQLPKDPLEAFGVPKKSGGL